MTRIEVTTADGCRLAACRFEPGGAAHAVILIAPAMGAAQRYYAPFATWLSGRGYLVITFDHRGIGASAPRSLRGFDATLTDWVMRDCAAMLGYAANEADGRDLVWLGHSLGAQVLPMVPNAALVTRMVMVATGTGYWRLHDLPMKLRAGSLWFGIAPVLVPLAGYFPGKALGIVGDLPAGVMRQWRRWCLHPRYCAGVERADTAYDAFTKPVSALSFTDDEFMSARNTDALYALYRNAPLDAVRMAPADTGLRRIGHFGFFRKESGAALWPRLLPGIDARRG